MSTFDSVQADTLRRALADLQSAFSIDETMGLRKRISDFKDEIKKRESEVENLASLADDALNAGYLAYAVDRALACAFFMRADMLREVIKKKRPDALRNKLCEAEKLFRTHTLVIDILETVDKDFVDGLE